MNKKLHIYIGVLVVLLAAIIVLDMNQQKPINWQPTYATGDKIPFGLYILDHELQDMTGLDVTKFSVTPYEYLESVSNYDSIVATYDLDGTIFAISDGNSVDEESAKDLLQFAGQGNSVFLSMKSFPTTFTDSLKIKLRTDFSRKDSIGVWLANPRLGTGNFYLVEGAGHTFFSEVDTVNTTILGYQEGDTTRANFIKIHYKDSDIYLHTQPAAFTNLHLLKGNHFKYAERILSYLPKQNIYWFDPNDSAISSSQLRFIFSQPALRWAWYLFLGGMLVFILFNAKRKQRIVPIITPLQNTTVDFAKTIGNLYYQEGDYDTIIDKKIIYFLERIRTEYLMDTNNLDDDFIRKLQQKSGVDLVAIERAIFLINIHKKSPHNSIEEDLVQINNAIEKIIH